MRKASLGRALPAAALLLFIPLSVQAQPSQSPEQYFGFKMGADYKLVKWPQIMEYFQMLDESSDKMLVQEVGKSSMGNAIIAAFISSPENLANLERYKEISQRLADPRGLSPEAAQQLVNEGKLIAAVSCSLHASEIAASQMSLELAYDLLTKETPQVRDILDKVILILFPSHNPDGNIMVVDWYNQNLGTPFETSRMPWLYHKYVGHDNNRDWFMLNLQETQVITKFYFKEWFPQILYDLHQMGNRGSRLFVPPFLDPLNPNVHPLVWREIDLLGTNMFRALEENDHTGVAHSVSYTSWWQGTSLMQPWWHNMASVLSEGASVSTATPIFQKVEELTGHRNGLPDYQLRANFSNPWPGGWWRLRDLVEYEYTAVMAFLDTGAKYKDNFMRNFYTMGIDAVEKGKNEPPYAYVVPADQHDPNTAAKMINILMKQGAEVHVADEAFTAGNISYPQGSYVLLMAQPFRPFVKDIMEKQVYPDLRRFPGGPPIPPYDVAGYTLPLLMGVKRLAVTEPFEANLRRIDEAKPPAGTVQSRAGHAYILGHESNDSLIAVNRLLKAGHDVYWSENPVSVGNRKFAAGAMIIPVKAGIHSEMAAIAEDLSLQIYATNSAVSGSGYKLSPLELALYNPWGGNMDEGWCKWLFEQYEFPFTEVRNDEIKAGDLKNRYDVIVFADQDAESIIDGIAEGSTPPQYAGGIGQEGVANLGAFVKAGGTLVTLSSASALPIEAFGLPVVNTLEGMSDDEFFCPGSILSIEVDSDHPVGYGMERKAAGFFSRSLAFDILPTFQDGGARAVAKYSGQNTLMSGWILGENHLHNKVAVAEVSYGDGKVILFGFRVQNRAQPHGTFKLLFNSLYYRAGGATRLP